MILLCLSAICVVLVLLLILKINRTVNYWKNAGIPYEPFSSFLYYSFFRQGREDIFDMLEEYSAKYGPVYGTYQGLNPILRVSSPDGIKDALSRNFSNVHGRTVAAVTGSQLWDNNILALNYQKWKMVRPLSGHVLTGAKLKLMKNKIENVAKRLSAKLEKLAKTKSEISTAQYAQGVIMDAVSAVTFSMEVDALEDPNNVFIKHCTGIFQSSLGLTLLFSFPHILKYLPSVQFPTIDTEKFFTGFSKTLLKQRRQPGQKREESDVLDVWLETQKTNPELTDEMLISQMFVFFVAGYETSSYTLMFALHLLANHPKKQEEIYKNIVQNIADPNNITFEEYNKMKLVEACIYETLRLYPTDWIIDRIVTTPCTVAGVSLDEGVNVQVPIPVVQRNPERFYEPSQFRPERFVDGSNNTQEIMAFGEGPKNCVGQRMAVTQLIIVLVAILRTVRLEPASDDSYDPSLEYQPNVERIPGQMFLPFPKKPLKVKLAPRN